MSIAVSVENLSKKYLIKSENLPYNTLRDSISTSLKNIFSSNIDNKSFNEFWALKDISFNIEQGDRVAIIGRNGAGKSTLLKILSRITEPTEGTIKIKGKISSLLEVGTGFHPELTGRENIYLNGSILGMSKKEIEKKFDEIVYFSGVEKFIDTPVKRYSSGMYVRLAFSVSAHLDQDILIIDEVLAVGDSVFQKKCIDKMLEISKNGKTILFVSHNFSAIKSLCKKAILLNQGNILYSGTVEDTINKYLGQHIINNIENNLLDIKRNSYKGKLIFEKITFNKNPINFGESICFNIQLKTVIKDNFSDVDFGIAIDDKFNNTIIHCSNRFINKNISHFDDNNSYFFEIENILRSGFYSLTLFLRVNDQIQDWLENIVNFEILEGNPYNYNVSSQINGLIMPNFKIESIL